MALEVFSLEGFKIYAGITSVDKDAQLSLILEAMEEYIAQYTNVILKYDQYAYFDKQDYIFVDSLYLKNVPIISCIPPGDDGYSTSLSAGTHYHLNLNNGVVRMLQEGLNEVSGTAEDPIRLAYEGTNEVPADITLAGYELTKIWWKDKWAQSKTQRGQSVAKFNDSGVEIPPNIRGILDKYRLI